MKRTITLWTIAIVILGVIGIVIYPRLFQAKKERTILYWTDPMLPGDRSDHPGKSPMGMERSPVYADEVRTQQGDSIDRDHHDIYTCPMHPSVRQDHPGACPICGMTLVKKSVEPSMNMQEEQKLADVAISPGRQVLANVSTTIARRQALTRVIRAVGTIQYAEPNLRHITMRFPGRIERLFVSFTGQFIKKGDPVAEIYSPEAISAEQEYLLAFRANEQTDDSSSYAGDGSNALMRQSRMKLERWGFSARQIEELQQKNAVHDVVTIYSPISGTVLKKNADPQQYAGSGENLFDVADLSTVWMVADVYEYEIQSLKIGQIVEAESEAYPGEKFRGKVTFVSPTVDPSSRSIRVRAELPNPGGHLKVDMFVNALLNIDIPSSVVVPASAVLSTGGKDIVWVEKGEGIYTPRTITLGVRAGNDWQVLGGLSAGEKVVTSGGYLIDSESQLEAQ